MEVIKFLWNWKIKILLLSTIIFFSSCAVMGLTNDYGKVSESNRKYIHTFENEENLKNNEVYKINGIQLKELVQKEPQSLVVLFANGCHSKTCVPLNNYILYAHKNHLKLFLVMTGYENLHETLVQEVGAPLFSIDNEYYKSTFRFRYVDKFINDLLGKPEKNFNSIYLFKNGKLIESYPYFSDLK